jgi:hypothetical protein
MGLEEEIELLLRQRHAGIPWVLAVKTGQLGFDSFSNLSDLQFIEGLQAQINALNDAVLILARAIDELSAQDEPS